MSRISSEKAAQVIGNRYDLVLIASLRVRELTQGHRAKINEGNGNGLTALREIEEGLVGRDYLKRIKGKSRKQ